jgi:hypothetical protein
MTEEWKAYSPLVELVSDSLNEVQDELVTRGEALSHLLCYDRPNADAISTCIQEIKDDLYYEGIMKTWVIAHVRDGQEDEFVANVRVRKVGLIYCCLFDNYAFMCM